MSRRAVVPLREPDRAPLCDEDAERAVLSALLLKSECFSEVAPLLRPEDHFHDAHQWIHRGIEALVDEGHAVDVVTVASWLRSKGRLDQVGGTPYLAHLVDATPAVAHVGEHASAVRKMARRRRASAVGARLVAGEALVDVMPDLERLLEEADSDESTARRPVSIAEVVARWRAEGPLVHEPTGLTKLDELTGGGPVYGSRWYLAGAPDAGKTALLAQLAHVWATRGVTVGLLAVDEEPDDLAARFAQRVGYARRDTELRAASTLDDLEAELGSLPIRLYGPEWTIDSAAADLRAAAGNERAALLIDSLQTVSCDKERVTERELSEVQAVTARVRAIRRVATEHRLIAMATSELGRASYASEEARRSTSTLAGSKWSGATEYSARVLLGLRSVAGQTDLIDIELAKNKHGPRDERFHVRIDRASQSLWQVEYHPEPTADRSTERASRARAQSDTDAVLVARILLERPGIGLRELRAAAKARMQLGHERVDVALERLGRAVKRTTGPRGAKPMSLDLESLDDALRAQIGDPS